eukprot:7716637-Alexandrium_andersonii.AAC.1
MRKRAQTAAAAAARARGSAAGIRRHTLKPRHSATAGRSGAGEDGSVAAGQRGRGRAAGSRGWSGSARGARGARDRAAPRE